jgi:beta-glucosidase
MTVDAINPSQPAGGDRPAYLQSELLLDIRLDDLLGRMTLEEKVVQLYCNGRVVEMSEQLFDESGDLSLEKMAKLFKHGLCQLGRPSHRRSPRRTAELTNAIQRFLIEHTRLGIPAMFNEEGLHGLMGAGATSFPQAIALASTWDQALVEQVYTVVAREARSRGSNYIYAPVLDLARDPRWGRVEETYGEDPYLVSNLGVAAVRGLQGTGTRIGAEHVIAAAKHFAVHGQPEGGANAAPGNYSERIVREQFLPPFQAVVQERDAVGGVQAVMASYNEIDGIPAHINTWLLQHVLREEWGFEGFVTSDGFGVPQLISIHKAAANPEEAARLALLAGVDVEVPQGLCYSTLVEQIKNGLMPEAAVERAVRRILRAKFLLGLFDRPPYVDPDQAEKLNNCLEHRQLARQAAREAIVLLKNDGNLLPLNPEVNQVAVIGPNAASLNLGGYSDDPGLGVTILEGIQQYLEKLDLQSTDSSGDTEGSPGEHPAGMKTRKVVYAEGCRITAGAQDWRGWWEDEVQLSDPRKDDERISTAVELARQSDVVILVLGENEATCREAWWFNHLGDRDDLSLLGRQEELAQRVLATGTPTIVLLINGRPLMVNFLAEHAAALLECWYLGQEGGTAVAEVLFGEVNPSGKLPVTFPRSVGQLPVYYYQKPSARRGYLFQDNSPLFPFGYGLSYSHYEYQNLRLSRTRITLRESVEVRVDVTNCGTRPGAEIVQLYLRDQVSPITRPVLELRDFCRLWLQAGETRTVEFLLTPEKLAPLGAQARLEPGFFDVLVGPHSGQLQVVTLEVTAG